MIVVVNNHPGMRFSRKETLRTLQRVLRGEGKSGRSISVVFVNDRSIKKINATFLRHRYSTDVIGFPLNDGLGPDAELYINLDRAKSQAKEYRVSYSEEVRRLLIHGMLHMFGYKHNTPKNGARMRKREDRYLASLS